MEQKRTLWVAAAAGVFLLVAIGAALILYRPSVKDPVISSIQNQQSSAWINPIDSNASGNPDKTTDISTISVVPNSNDIYTDNTSKVDVNNLSVKVENEDNSAKASNVTKPVTTVVENEPQIKVAAPAASDTKKAAKPAETKTTQKKTSTVTEYWVQTGAFSSREYAENAQDSIAAYKIESEIFTKVVNGKTWYRVRMGPYKTHTEADYWMTVIRSDPIFADSFITEVKK